MTGAPSSKGKPATVSRSLWGKGADAMPYFPSGPCRHRGCPERAVCDGFCDEHRKERNRAYNRARRTDPARSDAFYNSREWRTLRRAYLEANPLCETCKRNGRLVAASVIDHRVPIKHG